LSKKGSKVGTVFPEKPVRTSPADEKGKKEVGRGFEETKLAKKGSTSI